MKKFYYVYKHIRLDNNTTFYIGRGLYNSVNKFKRAQATKSRNRYWHNIVNKHGFTHKIIAKFKTLKEADNFEKLCIRLYRKYKSSLTNISDGGTGGIIWNEHPFKGKSHSEKTKRIISTKNKGRKHTKEAKAKISYHSSKSNHPMWGKHHSKESKLKIIKSKGCKPFWITKNNVKLSKFYSQTECAKFYNLSVSKINCCLKNTRNQHKGYQFEYCS